MSSVQTGIFTLLEGPTVVSAVSGHSYWLASYCERYEDNTYQNRLGENSHIAQVDIVKGQYDDPHSRQKSRVSNAAFLLLFLQRQAMPFENQCSDKACARAIWKHLPASAGVRHAVIATST